MQSIIAAITAIFWQIHVVQSTKGICGKVTKAVEDVQLMALIYAVLPAVLALVTLIVAIILTIEIRKWQANEVKMLNETVKKLTESANQAGVPVSLIMLRAAVEPHETKSADDSSVDKQQTQQKSSTGEWLKQL